MAESGSNVGRYEVISRLGQGGMGSLFLAKDPKIGRLVAIKLVRQEFDTPEARHRFAREAQSAGTLRHPNIVTIFDVDEHQGLPFIAMEYVEGETLAEIIRRRAPIALTKRLRWMEELCAGLAYAHRQGVVHRDVKPANLMLDAEGTLKILDFGLARRDATKFTQSHVLVGTPNYMSPEQIRGGEVGPRSDIFSVGVVLYEVISYAEAFPGTLHQAMHKIVQEAPTPLDDVVPGLYPRLVAIVDRAIAKDPDQRYQDLAVLRGDLSEARQHLENESEQTPNTIPLGTRSMRELRKGASPATNPAASRHATNRVSLEKRRAAQIEQRLAEAREFLEAGEFEKARESCEQALLFDTAHAAGHQLMEEIGVAEQRAQVASLVSSARDELQRGQIDAASRIVEQAYGIDPQSTEVLQLREMIETAKREIERARQIQEILRRARARFAEGAYEVAIRTAGEVLALDAANAPALELQTRAQEAIAERDQRAAHDAAAQSAITAAREMFAAGRHADAIAALEAFAPQHALVSAVLTSLRAEHAAEEQQSRELRAHDEQRQREQERSRDEQRLREEQRARDQQRVRDDKRARDSALREEQTERARALTQSANERVSTPPAAAPSPSSRRGLTYIAAASVVAIAAAIALYVVGGNRAADPPAVSPSADATAVPLSAPGATAPPVSPPSTAAPTPATGAPSTPAPTPPAATPSASTAPAAPAAGEREVDQALQFLIQGRIGDAHAIATRIRQRNPRNSQLARLEQAIRDAEAEAKAIAAQLAASAATPPAAGAPSNPAASSPAASGSPAATSSPAAPAVTEPKPNPIPAAPAVTGPPPPAAPSPAEIEGPAIRAVIDAYAKAMSSRDVKSVSRIRTFTPAQARNWDNLFKNLKEFRLAVRVVGEPQVTGDKATVTVEERQFQVPRNSGIETSTNWRPQVYSLEKINGEWRILAPAG